MNITPFSFESNSIRVATDDNGEPLFFAQDVAEILGYSGTAAMNKIIDDDDKEIRTFQNGTTYTKQSLVNESGLYQAIFGSTKTEAKRFKKWVTAEVLPFIRKTGSYTAPNAPKSKEQLELLAVALDALNVCPSSKLLCMGKALDKLAPSVADCLPVYTVDAPNGQLSSEATASLKSLLTQHGVGISPIKINQRLEALGYIETRERPSTSGVVKKFKTITAKGLQFGKNIVSPNNPKETQPHWYVSTFTDLLNQLDTPNA